MANIYTVLQINSYIKNMFDTDFVLKNINIQGEISNLKYHTSGHIYFTLKDKDSTISAVMFAGSRMKGLNFRLRDGIKVVVTGNISVFEASGKYQIYAREIKETGSGELYERFVNLKNELEEMGMFDEIYKKPIPKNIKRLGVVTARTGAAVHDIISVSRRRNPGIDIILYPAKVQGEGAAESVCTGIRFLDKAGVDIIIVGRGGGSIEDLWAFNEECVAREVFNCNTPVISAVGHETDVTIADYVADSGLLKDCVMCIDGFTGFTIIDFVSDLRAPTPSAAAELAVSDVSKIRDRLLELNAGLNIRINGFLKNYSDRIASYNVKLNYLSPANILEARENLLRNYYYKLNNSINAVMKNYTSVFQILCTRLDGLSPLTRLKGGYSYVCDEGGNNINSVEDIRPDDTLNIYVTDGIITATAKIITKKEGTENDD